MHVCLEACANQSASMESGHSPTICNGTDYVGTLALSASLADPFVDPTHRPFALVSAVRLQRGSLRGIRDVAGSAEESFEGFEHDILTGLLNGFAQL